MKHKKIFCILSLMLLFMAVLAINAVNLHYKTNEVAVRVFYKNKAIENLTKNDFSLFVDGNQQEICGVSCRQNQIFGNKENRGRFFILIYELTGFNKTVEESLDYLFADILGEKDGLRIIVDNKPFDFPILTQKDKLKIEIKNLLKKKSIEKRKKLSKQLAIIKNKAYSIREPYAENLLRKYLEVYQLYIQSCLVPDLEWLNHFAANLEKEKRSKCVLHFNQWELFPKLGMTDHRWRLFYKLIMNNSGGAAGSSQLYATYARGVQRAMTDVEVALNVNRHLLPEKLSKNFYRADAVFYSFFMEEARRGLRSDFSYKRITRSLQQGLEHLAVSTGGEFLDSNDLVKTLRRLKKNKDCCYMLSYQTKEEIMPGHIEVKLKHKKYKVKYDDLKK